MHYVYGPDRYREDWRVGKVVEINESKLGNNNNNKGKEEKDRVFWEAWREVVTKYLCKSFHRVMRRRFYQ